MRMEEEQSGLIRIEACHLLSPPSVNTVTKIYTWEQQRCRASGRGLVGSRHDTLTYPLQAPSGAVSLDGLTQRRGAHGRVGDSWRDSELVEWLDATGVKQGSRPQLMERAATTYRRLRGRMHHLPRARSNLPLPNRGSTTCYIKHEKCTCSRIQFY